MINLTRINGQTFTLNDDLIETIESTPDTLICMSTGKKFVVQETLDEVITRIVEFRRRCAVDRLVPFRRSF
jgi:flagellar protein FlbD